MKKSLFLGFFGILAFSITGCGSPEPTAEAPLPSATVTRTEKIVRFYPDANAQPRDAQVGETVQDKNILETGPQSLAELEFEDATITRLGPNTLFTFDRHQRNLYLKQGKVLIQVFKGEGRCNVVTAAVTAAILGTTVLVDADAESESDAVYLLETSREDGLSVASRDTGERLHLQPGQYLAVPRRARNIPQRQALKPQSFDPHQLWEKSAVGKPMGNLRKQAEQHFGVAPQKRKDFKPAQKRVEKQKKVFEKKEKSQPKSQISKPNLQKPKKESIQRSRPLQNSQNSRPNPSSNHMDRKPFDRDSDKAHRLHEKYQNRFQGGNRPGDKSAAGQQQHRLHPDRGSHSQQNRNPSAHDLKRKRPFQQRVQETRKTHTPNKKTPVKRDQKDKKPVQKKRPDAKQERAKIQTKRRAVKNAASRASQSSKHPPRRAETHSHP